MQRAIDSSLSANYLFHDSPGCFIHPEISLNLRALQAQGVSFRSRVVHRNHGTTPWYQTGERRCTTTMLTDARTRAAKSGSCAQRPWDGNGLFLKPKERRARSNSCES